MTDRVVTSSYMRSLQNINKEHSMANDVYDHGHSWTRAQWDGALQHLGLLGSKAFKLLDVIDMLCDIKCSTFEKVSIYINECIDENVNDDCTDFCVIVLEQLRRVLIERCRKALAPAEEVNPVAVTPAPAEMKPLAVVAITPPPVEVKPLTTTPAPVPKISVTPPSMIAGVTLDGHQGEVLVTHFVTNHNTAKWGKSSSFELFWKMYQPIHLQYASLEGKTIGQMQAIGIEGFRGLILLNGHIYLPAVAEKMFSDMSKITEY